MRVERSLLEGHATLLLVAGMVCAALLSNGCDSGAAPRGVSAHDSRRQARPAPHARAPIRRPSHLPPGTVRCVELGASVEGRPLVLELFGNGADRVLIFGGIHGDEPTSAELARKFADHLRINWDLFEGKTIGILAEANPDGLIRKTRTNANGIDLNRNFPARNWSKAARRGAAHGPRPASEPETRAILKAMEIIQPARIVSIHSATAGHHCNNYDGPARLLAEAMGGHNRYPVKATMGYPTPGSFGSLAGVDRSIPTITLELPRADSGQRAWRDNAKALSAFIGGVPPVAR